MSPCFLSCQPLPWPCPAFWPVASGIIPGIRRGTPFPFFLSVFSPYKGFGCAFAFLFPAVFLCRSAFSLSDSPDIFPFPLSRAHVYIIMCPFPFLFFFPFFFFPPTSLFFSLLLHFLYFLFKKASFLFCCFLFKRYFCIRFRQRGLRCFDMMVCVMPLGRFSFPFFPSPFSPRASAGKKEEKTSPIIWSVCIKLLTFASAFLIGSAHSFFEQIYINDTSSTIARLVSLWWESALGKTKEPSTVPVSLFDYGHFRLRLLLISDILNRAISVSFPFCEGFGIG